TRLAPLLLLGGDGDGLALGPDALAVGPEPSRKLALRALESYSGRASGAKEPAAARGEWRAGGATSSVGRALLAQACSETLETAQKGQAGVLDRRDEALAALPLFARDAALRSHAAGRALALLIPQLAGPKDADKLSAFLDALPSDAREGGAG